MRAQYRDAGFFDEKIRWYENPTREISADDLLEYSVHLDNLIARYSRGDELCELKSVYEDVIKRLKKDDLFCRTRYEIDVPRLSHKKKYAGIYRNALVLLAWGYCLKVERAVIEILLSCCERGDVLFERIVGQAARGLELSGKPHFPKQYDGLYAVLDAPPENRAALVADYLAVWYSKKMKGFSFKDTHKGDGGGYVGYWCFEAAGVVAALGIDDTSFAAHPHYPKDLVAYYRSTE